MPDSDLSTAWEPGDDPLANLPGPAGAAVAQWRGGGLGDAKIRSQLLTAASWDGADGQIARLTGQLVPPPGPWQQALRELHRRDAVNLEREATESRRLSDALDAALTAEPAPSDRELPQAAAIQLAQPIKAPAGRPSKEELARRRLSQKGFTDKQREAIFQEFLRDHKGGRDALWRAYQQEIYARGRGPWLGREEFSIDPKTGKSSISNKRNPRLNSASQPG